MHLLYWIWPTLAEKRQDSQGVRCEGHNLPPGKTTKQHQPLDSQARRMDHFAWFKSPNIIGYDQLGFAHFEGYGPYGYALYG